MEFEQSPPAAIPATSKDAVGPCLICGELSFGKHYGCVSCLGCKTFFRRAVMHKQNTQCKKPGVCEVEMSARRLCRSCRYKKCLDMGMSVEALQPRRDLIGRRNRKPLRPSGGASLDTKENSNGADGTSRCYYQPLTPDSKCGASPQSPPPSEGGKARARDLLDLMALLTRIDSNSRARKFEMIRSRMEAKKLVDDIKIGTPTQKHDQLSIMLGSDISNVTQIEILSLLEWTQTLPGFAGLPVKDRTTLLKRFAIHHLLIEHGNYTAQSGRDDVWLISNGTCMPRSVNVLPEESKLAVSEDRKWRQEKLYKQMTDRCIDEVAMPLRRLNLMPEELVTLKIIMLFSCGNHTQNDDGTLFIAEDSRRVVLQWKNRVIAALFQFYKSIGYRNYEERFGNVILTISGIVSAAAAVRESYQVMRLFKIVLFDHISEQLLFDGDIF